MAGRPTETSPLVKPIGVSWANGYGDATGGNGKPPLSGPGSATGEEHRCHLPRQIRPHAMAGVAIGAGSFAQG